MANAIKQVSVQKGHDVSRFALQCFGGAGGQHACLVADALGMETVFIHPFAGVLSAYGMGLADQAVMREQAVEVPLAADAMADLEALADRLAVEARRGAGRPGRRSGAHQHGVQPAPALRRHRGGADRSSSTTLERIVADFTALHRARFGFATPDRPLVVEAVAVEADARRATRCRRRRSPRARAGAPAPLDRIGIFTGGAAHDAPVFDRTALLAGDRIAGPALIREANATTVVEPGWTRRGHRAGPHDAAPHRAAAGARRRPAAGGPTRCCWNCSTTCS